MTKKRILITIICVLIAMIITYLYINIPFSIGGTGKQLQEQLPLNTKLSAQEVQEDREQLIEVLESTHPYFVVNDDLTQYEINKEQYINATENDMFLYEFWAATAEYMAFFEDGHTKAWLLNDEYFDFVFSYHDGNVDFYTYDEELGWTSENTICSISGVPIERIIDVIDRCFPAENEYGAKINYDNYINSETVLKLAGVNTDGDTIALCLSDGTSVSCLRRVPDTNNSYNDEVANTWKMDGDVFVMNFTSCSHDGDFDESVKALKKAVDNGCTKVIIDVRNNGGGDDSTCREILKAMGMRAPRLGVTICFSRKSIEQMGYLRRFEGVGIGSKPSTRSVANPNVNLVILCNRYTFSSANEMCTFVRDGNLGILIGEPSSNSPTHFGNPIEFSLKNSHLDVKISHKYFVRPNGDITETYMVPDIIDNKDAYSSAMRYFESIS